MKVSIVIPSYNHWNLTHDLLYAITRYEREAVHEVVLVDDASTEEGVRDGIQTWMTNGFLPLKPYFLPTNRGFLKAANYGLMEATGDVKILVSNDVEIFGEFVCYVNAILTKNPKSLVGGVLLHHNTGWNTFNGVTFPYLEGWLLAATRAGWEELGHFDERFSPSDYEDMDLSTKARLRGYALSPLNLPHIKHIGAQTIGYNPRRQAITERNREKFEAKWVR